MKKNKIIALMIALLMMAALVVGCAPAASVEEAPAEPVAEEPVAEEPATEEQPQKEPAAEEAVAETRMITDHDGHEVEIPNDVNRVAVISFPPLPSALSMFLGSSEKIVGMHESSYNAAANGLLSKLFPEILDVNTDFMDGAVPNMESLLGLDPELVFYTTGNAELKEMIENAGLPAVAISAVGWDYSAIENYDAWTQLFSQIWPDQEHKAELVSEYSRETYDMIQERVGDLSEEEKTDALFLFTYDDTTMVTSGRNFFGQWWADSTGGNNVAYEIGAELSNAEITMEQVYEWDPDKIFITNFTGTQPEDLYNNTIGSDDWSSVSAVVNEEVYKMPLGSYRSYTPGVDTPITLLWMAKTMHPELFEDIDIAQEIKDYYMNIYGVELTDEDVENILNPPSEAATG